jgi:acyl carrier protein
MLFLNPVNTPALRRYELFFSAQTRNSFLKRKNHAIEKNLRWRPVFVEGDGTVNMHAQRIFVREHQGMALDRRMPAPGLISAQIDQAFSASWKTTLSRKTNRGNKPDEPGESVLVSRMETSSRVIAVLQKSLMLDREKFTPTALLVDDLGVSSLDRFELLMDLEDEFKIEMEETELVNVRTVGDLTAYIQARKGP